MGTSQHMPSKRLALQAGTDTIPVIMGHVWPKPTRSPWGWIAGVALWLQGGRAYTLGSHSISEGAGENLCRIWGQGG